MEKGKAKGKLRWLKFWPPKLKENAFSMTLDALLLIYETYIKNNHMATIAMIQVNLFVVFFITYIVVGILAYYGVKNGYFLFL